MLIFRMAVVALALFSGAATANDVAHGALRIAHPFARATPPGARAGGAYFTVDNSGGDSDRLVGVSSPAAANAELHTMTMDGGVMRMRAIAALDVPAGGTLALKPGGYHLMLLDLKRPLVAGDKIPVRLTFEKAGTIDIVVDVEPMSGMNPHQ